MATSKEVGGILNKEIADEILTKYPTLELILLSGSVSNRLVQQMLDLDKWLREELCQKMILAQMIYYMSGSVFRATEQTKAYIRERRR